MLKSQIHQAITSGKAKIVNISKNSHGDIKYQYVINVKGANGNSADVVVAHRINKKSGKPRIITTYVK